MCCFGNQFCSNWLCTLQLQEVTSLPLDGEGVKEIMEQCDVLCLLYDTSDPNSFSPIARMFVSEDSLGDVVPLVYTKLGLKGFPPFTCIDQNV